MAKAVGRPASVTIDDVLGSGVDISNDVTECSFSTPYGSQDTTGLDKSALERQLLLGDCTVNLTGVFNQATSHRVLNTTTYSSVTRTTVIALPGPATLTVELLFADYTVARGDDGSLTWTATGSLANGTVAAWT